MTHRRDRIGTMSRELRTRTRLSVSRREFLAAGAAGVSAAMLAPAGAGSEEAARVTPRAKSGSPLVDLHVHLDNSTIDKVLEISEKLGVTFGIVEHAGTKENKYPVVLSSDEELRRMEALFYGAHVTVCRQIGMPFSRSFPLGSGQGAAADGAAFQAWRAALKDDPDLGQDPRMMVPVFFDVLRKKTKVWVFLGWATRPVTISFAKRPAATVLDATGKQVAADAVDLQFRSARHKLAYPVTAEVYVTEILDRDEFRELCDKHKTRAAILANLK